MSLTRIIKSQARRALQGFRGRAVAILLLTLALFSCIGLADAWAFRLLGYDLRFIPWRGGLLYSQQFLLDPMALTVSAVTALIRIVLLVPLTIGARGWYLERTEGRARKVSYLFWPYESRVYFESIILWLELVLKKMFFLLLIFAAPVCAAIWIVRFFSIPFAGQKALALCLGIPPAFLAWLFLGRYDLAPLLLCEKYSKGAREAVGLSVKVMKGNKWRLLGFKLSFAWWWLPAAVLAALAVICGGNIRLNILAGLCVFVLIAYGIAAFLVVCPYYRMAHTMFCRYLYEELQMKQGAAAVTTKSKEPVQEEEDPLNRPIQVPEEKKKTEQNPKETQDDQEYYL